MSSEIKTIEKTDIVVPLSPAEMTLHAIQQGATPEQLLKYIELQERAEANEAKKQYNLAVANFKANSPTVYKDLENKQFGSMYTSKGNLLNTVNPVLSEYGLNARFDLDQSDGVKVTCVLTHAAGHSESTSFSAPPDKSGSKNPIQEIKSTITYGQIITFESITGLTSSAGSMDNDGNSVFQSISEEQAADIRALMIEVGADEAKYLKFMKASTIEDIQASDMKKAIASLEKKRK